MVSIVKRRSVPKKLDGKKLLKLCVVCRHNKTKCDALVKSPYPCTYCSKKRLVCVFDTMKPTNRSYDLVERLVAEVLQLHRKLDSIVDSKNRLLRQLLAKERPLPPTPKIMSKVLHDSHEPLQPGFVDLIPTLSLSDSFVLHSNLALEPCSVSVPEARRLFDVFQQQFLPYLPVLPHLFFATELHQIHAHSDLLFWVIIVTALLAEKSENYPLLLKHVQNLVVVSCWFNTPRSLYSLVALLILASWPLPEDSSPKVQNNISVKYISLMKNLALQFGLHKLTFLDEFSKKTDLDLHSKPDDININTIRERIYKFININSNYWLVFLGLSNSNYNGFHQDYIINKAANVDIFHPDSFLPTDNFVNSLLKVSLVQLKMNESMNDLVDSGDNVSKLIQLNLFEQILDNYSKPDSPLLTHHLIPLTLEYSKLQLFVYYFSASDIPLDSYRDLIYRALASCSRTLDLFSAHFAQISNINQVPIYYRFGVELASLLLLQIHSCPLLRSIDDYLLVKSLFQKAYTILTTCPDPKLSSMNKLLMIIRKFDSCDRAALLNHASASGSFLLIKKMGNYLISGLHYEIIWQVYQAEVNARDLFTPTDWSVFGLDPHNDAHMPIINYISLSKSIFS